MASSIDSGGGSNSDALLNLLGVNEDETDKRLTYPQNGQEASNASIVEKINYLINRMDAMANQVAAINRQVQIEGDMGIQVAQASVTLTCSKPTRIDVKWIAKSEKTGGNIDMSSIKGYEIWYGTHPDTSKMTKYAYYDKNATNDVNSGRTVTMTGLTPSTHYYIWVTTIKTDGSRNSYDFTYKDITTTAWSNVQIQSVSASRSNNSNVSIYWSQPSGLTSSDIKEYKVYYKSTVTTTTSTSITLPITNSEGSVSVTIRPVIKSGVINSKGGEWEVTTSGSNSCTIYECYTLNVTIGDYYTDSNSREYYSEFGSITKRLSYTDVYGRSTSISSGSNTTIYVKKNTTLELYAYVSAGSFNGHPYEIGGGDFSVTGFTITSRERDIGWWKYEGYTATATMDSNKTLNVDIYLGHSCYSDPDAGLYVKGSLS